ncbi:hypothetical protein AN217_25870 [Streptomyces qinglanensis]|uniref:Uncharacterized protein n=1 Tax=Streptomyces qinglanensis TaxID=943816 RepID=A0A1E7K9R2_9ACTN|nr:hypothetical protein [Streptomyces qinglanensis]OEV00656.1 hypothetical protein AN217_25870 [Streptomyces qinglanensis]OEV24743.1 hypothetical protein AN220_17505 [Streptomyces nanshensis]
MFKHGTKLARGLATAAALAAATTATLSLTAVPAQASGTVHGTLADSSGVVRARWTWKDYGEILTVTDARKDGYGIKLFVDDFSDISKEWGRCHVGGYGKTKTCNLSIPENRSLWLWGNAANGSAIRGLGPTTELHS